MQQVYICKTCKKEFKDYICNIKTDSPCCSRECSAYGRVPPSQKGKIGNKNGMWKGNKVSYRPLHSWVERMLGKSDKCEICNKNGLKGHSIHWANKSHNYKRDINDWLRLCVKCHKQYDKRTI